MHENNEKAVLTVVGKDRVGIIAAVTALLADYQVNIEDISQTILKNIFNMIMMVDLSGMTRSFAELRTDLDALGVELGLSISIQHSAIFDSMHRI